MARSHQTNPTRMQRLLATLASQDQAGMAAIAAGHSQDIADLQAADLVTQGRDGALRVTKAGRAFLARCRAVAGEGGLDPFLAQHLALEPAAAGADPKSAGRATIDLAESPLGWLARRRGRDGRPLIAPEQFQAGERLRGEFTRAQMTPRVTANWTASASASRGGNQAAGFADTVIAAQQRVRRALDTVGPEFSGLLLDVCCFLKGLEDVERERRWPPRSAKVVLQLGLDRLARHYGLAGEARGRDRAPVRTWLAPDAAFSSDGT
jgi:hypothetical protein